ncbi:MAG: cupredoxin domain-containing protein [Sphingomicrobium sp.]
MRYAFLLAVPISILGAQPMAAQAPTVVNVQLANFKFTPKSIVLDHGHAYVLRLQNVASGGHDFTASDFFAAANVAAGDRRLISEGEVEVPAGQVREIHLTAPGAGKYSLKCSHSFHKMFGMSGSIIVR